MMWNDDFDHRRSNGVCGMASKEQNTMLYCNNFFIEAPFNLRIWRISL